MPVLARSALDPPRLYHLPPGIDARSSLINSITSAAGETPLVDFSTLQKSYIQFLDQLEKVGIHWTRAEIRRELCSSVTEFVRDTSPEGNNTTVSHLERLTALSRDRDFETYFFGNKECEELRLVIFGAVGKIGSNPQPGHEDWIWHVVRKSIDNIAVRFGSALIAIDVSADGATLHFDHDYYHECDDELPVQIDTICHPKNFDEVVIELPPKYDVAKHGTNPIIFYMHNWHVYAKRKLLYRHILRRHDPKLLNAIYIFCRRHSEFKIDEILPPTRKQFTDDCDAGLVVEDIRRMGNAIRQRRRRSLPKL